MKDLSCKLPEKLSALLRLALKDLEKCEKDLRFIVDMGQWYTTADPFSPNAGKCYVCLAGSILAQTCHVGDDPEFNFDKLDSHEKDPNYTVFKKMLAINALRVGEISSAFEHIDRAIPDALPWSRKVHKYNMDPAGFKEDMERIAVLLEAHGE